MPRQCTPLVVMQQSPLQPITAPCHTNTTPTHKYPKIHLQIAYKTQPTKHLHEHIILYKISAHNAWKMNCWFWVCCCVRMTGSGDGLEWTLLHHHQGRALAGHFESGSWDVLTHSTIQSASDTLFRHTSRSHTDFSSWFLHTFRLPAYLHDIIQVKY
eukprot:COSAG05_NODE_486_length_9342_cov_20.072271_8_plen_157_part_00